MKCHPYLFPSIHSGLLGIERPRLLPWRRDEAWLTEVNRPLGLDKLHALPQSVERGAPLGGPEWIRRLATEHGMESTIRPQGRPRKPSPET